MTKRREPLTYQHTLTKIAAVIGWDRCGAICGVTDRMVRYWSDPECETEIRLIDAERLDRAFIEHGGDHAPFHRLMSRRLDIAASDAEAKDLSVIAATTAKEAGEAVAALIEVSGNISDPAARRTARKEAQEAMDKLADGIAAIDRIEQRGNVK